MRALVCVLVLAGCSRSHSLPEHWKVSISFGAGLCQDTPTEACSKTWVVMERGPIRRTDNFRAGPKTRDIALTDEERKQLVDAVRSSKFWDGLEEEQPCPGEVNDLWVTIGFTNLDSGENNSHGITSCGLDNKSYFAEDVVRLVTR